VKYRDVMKVIEINGWVLVRTKGSHKKYAHPRKQGIVTVAPHGANADVPRGTLRAILKQAGLL